MSKKKPVPELRFPEFEEDWKKYKLSELFSISAGGDIDSNKVKPEPDEVYKYPVYANAEKKKGLYGYSSEYKIEPNVITVAGRGVNVGITHVRDHRFYPIVRLLVLNPKISLSIHFFEYQINRINIFLESTGVPQLTAPQISSYKVASTSIAEQEKIASFLGAIDTRLTQLRRKHELLQTYKRGVMQKIFSQEVRFKGAIGSEFPEWNFGLFYDCLNEIVDFRGRTPLKLGMEWGGGQIPALSANNVKNGYIDFQAECNLASEELHIKWMSGVDVRKGDIVFTMEAPLGNATLIPDSRKYILSQRVVLFKTKQNINNHFLIQLVWSPFFQKLLQSLSTGTTAKGINQKSLKKIEIYYPNIEEQEKIADFLTAIDRKIKAVAQQIDRTKQFKKGLLQKMFV